MKRLLSFLLAFVMFFAVFSCVPLTAKAAEKGELHFDINYDDYESYNVWCHEGKYDEVVFPSVHNGLPVARIVGVSLPYEGNIKITIPDSVTEISEDAFCLSTSISEFFVDDDNQHYKSVDGVLYSKDGKVLIRYPQTKADDTFVVPDGVEVIASYAFYSCKNLNYIYFSDSVKRVGAEVFYNSGYYDNSANWTDGALYNNNHLLYVNSSCSGEFVVKDGTKSIADGAFGSNDKITSIVLPESLKIIGNNSIAGCDALTDVSFANGLERIGELAFWGCDLLSSIQLPESIEFIGRNAFNECHGLTSVTFPEASFVIDEAAFSHCNALTEIEIPESIVSVGGYVFANCENLSSVILPDCVTDYGSSVFENTAFYNNTDNWENGALYIGNHLIEVENSYSGDFIVKEGTKVITSNAFSNCESLLTVTIPETVVEIGRQAFWCCENLTSVNLPSQLTVLRYNVFGHCKKLTNITIPESVTVIEEAAFWNCNDLNDVTFPENLEYIGNSAFVSCEKFETVYIPENVKYIGQEAFSGGEYLHDIIVDENNEYYKSVDGVLFDKNVETLIQYPARRTGQYKWSETSYEIPNTVKTIGNYAFGYCYELDEIIIPDSVTYIGNRAFVACRSFTALDIPDSVTYLGPAVFSSCKNLTDISLPKNLNFISWGCFENCTSLETIDIPSTVEAFVEYAFYGCSALKSFVVPYGVNSINYRIFYDCTSLESITIPETVKSITNFVFYSCESLKYVFFGGTEEQWNSVAVEESGNQWLLNAKFHFGAAGHTLSSWITDKKATVYSAGKKHRECTECGEILETVAIAQLKAAKPTLKSIENTEYGVLTKWGEVKGADTYRVYRKTSKTDWEYIGSTSKTYYTDKTVKSGTKYYYAVRARNEAGNSSLSSSLSKLYLADPTLKTLSSTKSGVKLTWSKASGAEGYMVYRKTGTGSYSKIASVKGSTKVTYTDKTAKKGKTYTYKIKAYKSKTYSEYSNAKKIKDKY
jgi:hypothetical protein